MGNPPTHKKRMISLGHQSQYERHQTIRNNRHKNQTQNESNTEQHQYALACNSPATPKPEVCSEADQTGHLGTNKEQQKKTKCGKPLNDTRADKTEKSLATKTHNPQQQTPLPLTQLIEARKRVLVTTPQKTRVTNWSNQADRKPPHQQQSLRPPTPQETLQYSFEQHHPNPPSDDLQDTSTPAGTTKQLVRPGQLYMSLVKVILLILLITIATAIVVA